MSEISDTIQLFCQQPPNDEARWRANRSWFEFVMDGIMTAIDRVLKKPTVAIQDRLLLYELLYLNLLRHRFLYEAFWSSAYNKRLFIYPEAGKEKARIALTDSAKENVLFTQEFDGEVTSVSDKQVIVRFKVADDLEERRFDVSELSHPLREGQAVQARCHLELIPPKGALTDEQIREYEARYNDLDEQLRKAQLKEDMQEEMGG